MRLPRTLGWLRALGLSPCDGHLLEVEVELGRLVLWLRAASLAFPGSGGGRRSSVGWILAFQESSPCFLVAGRRHWASLPVSLGTDRYRGFEEEPWVGLGAWGLVQMLGQRLGSVIFVTGVEMGATPSRSSV